MRKPLRSFYFAIKGIGSAAASERNMRFHLLAAVLAICSGFYFDITTMEWVALVLSIGLVLAAEIFNTSIEKLVDLVSPGHHEIAGRVKDLAAGAVLICAITAAVTGLIIFLPKL